MKEHAEFMTPNYRRGSAAQRRNRCFFLSGEIYCPRRWISQPEGSLFTLSSMCIDENGERKGGAVGSCSFSTA